MAANSEYFMILAYTVLIRLQSVTDGRTDGRTDRRQISYGQDARSILLSRVIT